MFKLIFPESNQLIGLASGPFNGIYAFFDPTPTNSGCRAHEVRVARVIIGLLGVSEVIQAIVSLKVIKSPIRMDPDLNN